MDNEIRIGSVCLDMLPSTRLESCDLFIVTTLTDYGWARGVAIDMINGKPTGVKFERSVPIERLKVIYQYFPVQASSDEVLASSIQQPTDEV